MEEEEGASSCTSWDSIQFLPILDVIPTSNRELWEENRKKLKKEVFFCSKAPNYCNVGYESCYKTLNETISDEKKEEKTNYFKEKAMKHGTELEPEAMDVLMTDFGYKKHDYHSSDNKVSLPTFVCQWKDIKIAGTPDFIAKDGTIVEIKCPYYYTQQHLFPHLISGVKAFYNKYPFGKQNAFVQALLYSIMTGSQYFMVFNYFADSFEEGVVYFLYQKQNFVELELYDRLFQIKQHIEKKTLKKMPSYKKRVENIWMKSCFIHKVTIGVRPKSNI